MTNEYAKLQVIYDHDHGQINQGWYLRTRTNDGAEQDIRVEGLDDLGSNASDSDLRSAAIDFLFEDVTEEQDAQLHCDIEVNR